uniref:Small ribosomal subunit protein uS13m n=1 Tax=Lobosphaera incisa TaxID=312850 RepID=A0A0F7DYX3_9CHLO|nr:ribosomal protein S13 [Lobosphaera incisa]AKF78655.1 ribosomal protein S13 [Lobosphaera incisa]
MIFILNTNLKNEKKVSRALCEFFGLGKQVSHQICDQLGISDKIKVNQLTNSQIDQLTQLISQNYLVGADLRRTIKQNIKRLVSISSYRGFRHTAGLPVRGQRTHTNAKTIRTRKK